MVVLRSLLAFIDDTLLDQSELMFRTSQEVIAEGGVEGLTKYLAKMGQSDAKVLTPEQIRKRQEEGKSLLTGDDLPGTGDEL